MGLKLNYLDGQTPLEPEDIDALRVRSIQTQGKLNRLEQLNINLALQKLQSQRIKPNDLFEMEFVLKLHKLMFGQVWKWAGQYRRVQTNIGVDPYQIPVDLRQLLDDTKYQWKAGAWPDAELCLRFKHRLVSIHCFPNGNGRHARLMADLLHQHLFGKVPFQWGNGSLIEAGELRKTYINALRSADNGQYKALIDFALGQEYT
jgi:Fic-DOC domain mobile mystery protein B